jgi:hypothetical protein
MQVLGKIVCIAGCLTIVAQGARATDCSAWPIGASSEAYMAPLSVPADRIGARLMEISGGVQVSSELKGDELWIDITEFPGDVTAAAAPRIVMQAGRLAAPEFSLLVMSDSGRGIFSLNEADARRVGCQFQWGVEGGENPIHLLREMYKAMRFYETDRPVTTGFTGSLLGDTGLALNLNNEVFLPQWVMSAVK